MLGGGVGVTLFLQERREVVMGVGVIGDERQDAAEGGDRQVGAAGFRQDASEARPCLDERVVDFDRAEITFAGRFDLAVAIQEFASWKQMSARDPSRAKIARQQSIAVAKSPASSAS